MIERHAEPEQRAPGSRLTRDGRVPRMDLLSLEGYQLPMLQSIARELGLRSSRRSRKELMRAIREHEQERDT